MTPPRDIGGLLLLTVFLLLVIVACYVLAAVLA